MNLLNFIIEQIDLLEYWDPNNFYKRIWRNLTREKFQGHRLVVTQAPEPSDVHWENLGISSFEKFGKRILTALFTILILALVWFIIFRIDVFKVLI